MTQYKGTSKVHSPCQEIVKNLQSFADQSTSMFSFMAEGGGYRKWNQGWHFERNIDPTNLTEVHDTTFSRANELDVLYNEVYKKDSPGTDGDARAIKLQAAYLQAMERAFNLRHCSVVRSEALAASRRKGQGNEKGPLIGPSGVLGYIQRIIEKSQT